MNVTEPRLSRRRTASVSELIRASKSQALSLPIPMDFITTDFCFQRGCPCKKRLFYDTIASLRACTGYFRKCSVLTTTHAVAISLLVSFEQRGREARAEDT